MAVTVKRFFVIGSFLTSWIFLLSLWTEHTLMYPRWMRFMAPNVQLILLQSTRMGARSGPPETANYVLEKKLTVTRKNKYAKLDLIDGNNNETLESNKEYEDESWNILKKDEKDNSKLNNDNNFSVLALPWWEKENLPDCTQDNEVLENRITVLLQRYKFYGHCGVRASKNKFKQKVISYTVYGNVTNYLQGFHLILRDVGQLYPGWLVRLYTDPRSHYEYFCPLMREFPYFFICDTKVLSEVLHVDEKMNSMMWRTAPFGDKQVERFVVRDIDSKLTSRERVAVQVWERSGRLLHLMRDHPQHTAVIMGGMYGVLQPPRRIRMFEHIRRELFLPSTFTDQEVLQNTFPYELVRDSVQHMSYNCWWFKGTQPFPTQRQHGFFVGNPRYRPGYNNATVMDICHEICRPPEHKDWVYC